MKNGLLNKARKSNNLKKKVYRVLGGVKP